MNAAYLSAELRRLVAVRAMRLCEYCLLHEDDMFFGCEVDHIISKKHGGPTHESNLAYACLMCNCSKGSDISSLAPGSSQLVRFFHPRQDRWSDHFRFASGESAAILALTEIGEATQRNLGLNNADRLLERHALTLTGR